MIDLGSHTCKAGYAGEDAPKAVFPSVRQVQATFFLIFCVSIFDLPTLFMLIFFCLFVKVVGSIDQMDDDDDNENNDSKANNNSVDSNKPKGKRRLYVGSQALGFRRDHMEVRSMLDASGFTVLVYLFYFALLVS